MRSFVFFLPAILLAQTPAVKAPAAKPAARPAAAATRRAGTAARRPGTAAKPKPAAAAPVVLTTDDEKTIYALGLTLHRSLSRFDLSPAEMEIFKRALSDAAANKPAVPIDEWGPKIEGFARARATRVMEHEKVVSKAYLDKAATEAGAVKTESGVVYREVRPGLGASPKAEDRVKVNYRGTLVNGTEFDSSYKRGQPAEFPLNGVIKCWTEGVQKMKVGGKSVLVCPSDLAYGDAGRPTIPGGAALIFEIELLEVTPAPAGTPAP